MSGDCFIFYCDIVSLEDDTLLQLRSTLHSLEEYLQEAAEERRARRPRSV